MSVGLSTVEAMVKTSPRLQQFASDANLGSTIAAWREQVRARELALSLTTPMQQQSELAVKQLPQRSPQRDRVSAPLPRTSSPSPRQRGSRSPVHSPAFFLAAMWSEDEEEVSISLPVPVPSSRRKRCPRHRRSSPLSPVLPPVPAGGSGEPHQTSVPAGGSGEPHQPPASAGGSEGPVQQQPSAAPTPSPAAPSPAAPPSSAPTPSPAAPPSSPGLASEPSSSPGPASEPSSSPVAAFASVSGLARSGLRFASSCGCHAAVWTTSCASTLPASFQASDCPACSSCPATFQADDWTSLPSWTAP
ncbi:mucin-1-like [Oreochromis niloticus]|uniref:mucin-1-like n=1 Tax=Oreochromis niloticus TaxID=8128 RepID=UPI000DF46A4C|nr:mucin-1-like [Oreochromis niloticus]XP_025757823.1 mucin-1-like [Oreochromis niloticus]